MSWGLFALYLYVTLAFVDFMTRPSRCPICRKIAACEQRCPIRRVMHEP